jgi:small GTP-binding protein
MIQKKICMLGSFAVGKTSLVARFVRSMFSEKYHTTVGVKIDKKILEVDDTEVNLILWDLAGEDEYQKVRMSYLRGAAGYILVVDGTRPATLDTALSLRETINEQIGDIPFVMLFNKSDLTSDWEIKQETIDEFAERGWLTMPTSAKSGENVERAFSELSRMMVTK